MARSRPFGVFILVLCLVACVCAHGDVSDADATKAVKEAQKLAKKLFDSVKSEIRVRLIFLKDIDTYKINAQKAATEAEKAAKSNSEAESIAEKAKKASDEALKLYPNASGQANKYLESMRVLRTKANTLDDKAKNDLFISRLNVNNYTKIKEDADAIKSQVEALDQEYNKELSSFSDVHATQNEMLKFVSDAQLARYQVDAIVAVAKMDTLLESAERDSELIEQKRDEISATVQEVKNLYDNSPENLNQYIHALYSWTKTEFESASKRVEEAQKTKKSILEQKAQANEALVKVKDETDVKEAKNEVEGVNNIAKNAEKNVEEIKRALESATASAANAVYRKDAAVNELNRNTKIPDVTQDNKKTNPPNPANTHQPVKDTTESPTVSGTIQPTITNPDQSITEQPMKDTTESPTMIGTKKPTITKPDQPGSGGTKNTQPSSSDSAMTVSVPLLLTLIACGALH